MPHLLIRRGPAAAVLGLCAALAAGCELAFSDVATRIRYALLRELAEPGPAGETRTLTLQPNRWPDGCPGNDSYQLTLSPYRGGKQVKSGDIAVRCERGKSYGTGLGSEAIVLAGDLSVTKHSAEAVNITLRRTGQGLEIVALR